MSHPGNHMPGNPSEGLPGESIFPLDEPDPLGTDSAPQGFAPTETDGPLRVPAQAAAAMAINESPRPGQSSPSAFETTPYHEDEPEELKRRNARDEHAIERDDPELFARFTDVASSLVAHETDGTNHRISLPHGNSSNFTIRQETDQRIATDWRIEVTPEMHDLGIGRRLARSSVYEMLAAGATDIEMQLTSEAELRIIRSIFPSNFVGTTVRDATGRDDQNPFRLEELVTYYAENEQVLQLEEVLKIIRHNKRVAAGDPGQQTVIRAAVNVAQLKKQRVEYDTVRGQRVLETWDLFYVEPREYSDVWSEEHQKEVAVRNHLAEDGTEAKTDSGEVRQAWRRLSSRTHGDRTLLENMKSTIAELQANAATHTYPHHPDEHYIVRLSELTGYGRVSYCVETFFYGELFTPGLSEELNMLAAPSMLRSLYRSGRTRRPADRSKQDGRLQQSGRGATIFAEANEIWFHREFFREAPPPTDDGTHARILGGGFAHILAAEGTRTLLDVAFPEGLPESEAPLDLDALLGDEDLDFGTL